MRKSKIAVAGVALALAIGGMNVMAVTEAYASPWLVSYLFTNDGGTYVTCNCYWETPEVDFRSVGSHGGVSGYGDWKIARAAPQSIHVFSGYWESVGSGGCQERVHNF